jgi:hypothetical protein
MAGEYMDTVFDSIMRNFEIIFHTLLLTVDR